MKQAGSGTAANVASIHDEVRAKEKGASL